MRLKKSIEHRGGVQVQIKNYHGEQKSFTIYETTVEELHKLIIDKVKELEK